METTAKALMAVGQKVTSGRKKWLQRRLLEPWFIPSFDIRRPLQEWSPLPFWEKAEYRIASQELAPDRGPTHSCIMYPFPPCLQTEEAVQTSNEGCASRIRMPGFRPHLCLFPAVWPWTCYLTTCGGFKTCPQSSDSPPIKNWSLYPPPWAWVGIWECLDK